jgi:hypothetical protein
MNTASVVTKKAIEEGKTFDGLKICPGENLKFGIKEFVGYFGKPTSL